MSNYFRSSVRIDLMTACFVRLFVLSFVRSFVSE